MIFKFLKTTAITVAIMMIAGCGSIKNSVSPLLKADELSSQGLYSESYLVYKEYIAKLEGKSQVVDAEVLKNAALAAEKSGHHESVLLWYDKLSQQQPLTGDQALAMIESAKIIGDDAKQTNLMKSLGDVLLAKMGEEHYNSRLCQLYGEAGNAEGVAQTWEKADKSTRLKWFDVFYKEKVKAGEDKNSLIDICSEVLKMDAKFKPAMHNKAILLYEKSEARYNQLMTEYNKKKTPTTHAILMRDLKVLSADYRTCRELFEGLRAFEPDTKSYVQFLYNVYVRLDLSEKAKQLQKLL